MNTHLFIKQVRFNLGLKFIDCVLTLNYIRDIVPQFGSSIHKTTLRMVKFTSKTITISYAYAWSVV